MSDPRKRLVERLFAEHGRALLGFFYNRLRTKSDAADLAQEVYVRMMRVPDATVILDPQRYLYTVANNLLKEYAIVEQRRRASVDVDDEAVRDQLSHIPDFDFDVDAARRAKQLGQEFQQLSAKCRATIVLMFRDGLSYKEIAGCLGISPDMVKKYRSQGLAHLREQLR